MRCARRVPDRRRPAPDADRRARRPAPAGPPRHRPAAAERDAARARARRPAGPDVPRAPHARRRRRAHRRRRLDAGARRGGLRRARRGHRRRRAPRSARPGARWRCGRWASTSRRSGTLKNRALLNLCLATGNIGRPGSGPLSLTGQPNAMGGRETGGLARLLPGYRKVVRRRGPRARCGACGTRRGDLRGRPGWPSTELVEALEDGRVKVRVDRRHQPGRLAARRGPLRRRAAPRRAGDRPGRVLPDRDGRARPRAAARRAAGRRRTGR